MGYSNTTVSGGNECGKSGQLYFFIFLKHLHVMNAFEVQFFQGVIFMPYQRH